MGIHRLMIVDDDEILREGIEKNADWMANGIQVVGTARNGRECLEMIPDCSAGDYPDGYQDAVYGRHAAL
jgi:YesN/AraC family two-component response regulator